jgi:aspartyl-tRNA(Asn)/glutamyl-tRNA(Gln) amidotransferase subunit A
VPERDATAVARLRGAGAVVVGKTHLNEFAMGPTGWNAHYGPARNPWNPEHITGGSSSGSAAAVVTGMALAGLGSDTGGSIRIPASACGCVGLKPTYGRVSRAGAFPLAWSLDHVGPLTTSAEDSALLLGVLAGWDARDPASSREPVPDYVGSLGQGAGDLRIVRPRSFDAIDSAVTAVVEQAIADMTPLVRSVTVSNFPPRALFDAAYILTTRSEATTHHRQWMRERAQDYSPEVLGRLDFGLLISSEAYLLAQQARGRLRAAMRTALQDTDVFVTVTLPIPVPRIGAQEVTLNGRVENVSPVLLRYTSPVNLIGYPACTIPAGFTPDGLPVGVQLMASPFREDVLLRLAHAYQRATDWHLRRPA